ncbi:MAG: molybdopterin-dependent oxidoreductase [Promethearchaeota archaeon]
MAIMHIDGRKLEFEEKGDTILDVARQFGIYIPTLCDHDELESHGGCRMCIVQVEGMRGFPPACSTAAKDGMQVKTSTEKLLTLKRRIMQLLLMEHPSACMVCAEQEGCNEYRPEPYKAGRVTGCTTCPNRYTCQLREVVEFLGIKNLDYLPHYKEIEVERHDPFFDRDYNLCILCARCIRVCDDIRGTSAITFAKRGHKTRVDTSFGISHIESGCWFCGACIDVCPTGSLKPRMTKWTGAPDSIEETTCVLCGLGCQTQFNIKWNRVMGSEAGSRESSPNHGHMCVIGRFCIPSLVNAPDRIRTPRLMKEGSLVPVSWEEALDETARILKEANPERVGFIGSPQMSTESAYLFHKLARVGVRSPNVDFQGSDFPALIHKELAAPQDFAIIRGLDHLDDVDWIMSVGGDFVKTHQVVAKVVYKQVRQGKPLIAVGSVGDNLQRWAAFHFPMRPKDVPRFLKNLAESNVSIHGTTKAQAQRLIEITGDGKGAILLGPRILEIKQPNLALRTLVRLAGEDGAIYPLFPLGNEAGALRAGLRPEMLPGPTSVTIKDIKRLMEKTWEEANFTDGLHLVEMRQKAKKGELDVLYIAEGSLSSAGFEKVPTVIYQSPYPSEWSNFASVILPAAAFLEESGTFINLEMKPLKIKPIAKGPGTPRQDWQIFAELGQKIGAKGFAFETAEEVWKELSRFTRSIETGGQTIRASWKPASREKNDWYPRYRGAVIPERIEDLAIFIDALPDRDRPPTEENLDELVKRVQKERAAKAREVVS